jgi:hypothetical protein
MSLESFPQQHNDRKQSVSGEREFVAESHAEIEAVEKERQAGELAALVKSYLEKQMQITKVKEQLPIIAARIHQKNTTPELRGEAMKMKEDLEAEIYALEFEQKRLGDEIRSTGGNTSEYTVQ